MPHREYARALGITNLCLAVELPPACAVAPGFCAIFSLLVYMMVTKQGITGVPGITGPPIPAR